MTAVEVAHSQIGLICYLGTEDTYRMTTNLEMKRRDGCKKESWKSRAVFCGKDDALVHVVEVAVFSVSVGTTTLANPPNSGSHNFSRLPELVFVGKKQDFHTFIPCVTGDFSKFRFTRSDESKTEENISRVNVVDLAKGKS